MPLNDRKVISIILEQSRTLDQRCPGYREEIVDVISAILGFERQNRVQGTHIQKKITDKCNATARLLMQRLGHDVHEDQDT